MTANADWFEKRCADIQTINASSIADKPRTVIDIDDTVIVTKSKLNKFRKLNFRAVGSIYFPTYTTNYYHEGSFLFANETTFVSIAIQKGVKQADDPLGEVVEMKVFFNTKMSGIKLKRSIAYFDKSEIDSLVDVLSEMEYDTLTFRKSEYKRNVESYKRIKSLR